MKIQGMYASVATPFDHTGAMYRVKVQHNFEKWSRTSLAGFIVGSLTGEGPLLEAEEKVELLRLAAPHIPAGRTLIADISEEGVHARCEVVARGGGGRRPCGDKRCAAPVPEPDLRAGSANAVLSRAGRPVAASCPDPQ